MVGNTLTTHFRYLMGVHHFHYSINMETNQKLHGKIENLWIGLQLVVDELRDLTCRIILPIVIYILKNG